MIVSFPSKQSATEFAEQNGLTAHRRAYDDVDGPAGSWYVVVTEASEKHE